MVEACPIFRRRYCKPSKIAQKVGVSTRTVQRYLHMPTFPERQTRSDRGKSLLNPYKEYVLQLWNSGEHKTKKIFRKLQKKGYHGSYMTVNRYIHRLCQAQGWELYKPPKTLKLPPVADPQKPPLTPKHFQQIKCPTVGVARLRDAARCLTFTSNIYKTVGHFIFWVSPQEELRG